MSYRIGIEIGSAFSDDQIALVWLTVARDQDLMRVPVEPQQARLLGVSMLTAADEADACAALWRVFRERLRLSVESSRAALGDFMAYRTEAQAREAC